MALDISKAFDRVWHESLLSKLPSFGFPPSHCSLMSSFLASRSISAVVDGATSSSFSVNSDVPQGSVLSPTLFLLFINDLLNCTSNSIHSYADDSTLHSSTHFNYVPSFTSRIASRLNLSDSILADLDRISGWGSLNLVKFNSLKTQLLQISLSKTPSNFPISFDGSLVSPVDNINILGLNINKKMSWKPHITTVAKAASRKLGVLFRLRGFFSSSQLFHLYKGLIRPCMEYCSHIWGGGALVSPGFWTGSSQRPKGLSTVLYFPVHLTLYLCGAMLVPYLFSIGTAAAGARGSLSLACHHLYDALVAQGVLCRRMSFALILVTLGWFAAVLPSFLPPLFCGILFHLLCFLLNLISFTLKPASVLICVVCVS